MVAKYSSRGQRRKGHVGKVFPDKSLKSLGGNSGPVSVASRQSPPASKTSSATGSRTSSSSVGPHLTDKRPNSLDNSSGRNPSASSLFRSGSHTAAKPLDLRTSPSKSSSATDSRPNAILARLSENLRRLRQARGDTQRELAHRCGFTHTYISNVEQGRINLTLANLETLARGLNCCATDLVRRPPPRPTVATASPPAPNHGGTREHS